MWGKSSPYEYWQKDYALRGVWCCATPDLLWLQAAAGGYGRAHLCLQSQSCAPGGSRLLNGCRESWFILLIQWERTTHAQKKKKFSIILQNWLVLRPDGYKTQPGRGLGTRTVGSRDSFFRSSLQLCWIRRNIKSYRWPYKNTVKVMCELYGWCVVGFLYVAEFCCLKNSIPVESRTSTMLTASDNSYQWVQFDDFIWLILNILNLLNEWAVMPAVW